MTTAKLSALIGRRVQKIESDGLYAYVTLSKPPSAKRSQVLQIRLDSLFDRDGMLFEDNAPYCADDTKATITGYAYGPMHAR